MNGADKLTAHAAGGAHHSDLHVGHAVSDG
jgi:hypothetical protein